MIVPTAWFGGAGGRTSLPSSLLRFLFLLLHLGDCLIKLRSFRGRHLHRQDKLLWLRLRLLRRRRLRCRRLDLRRLGLLRIGIAIVTFREVYDLHLLRRDRRTLEVEERKRESQSQADEEVQEDRRDDRRAPVVLEPHLTASPPLPSRWRRASRPSA